MDDWRTFLKRYSEELLATSDLWIEVPDDVWQSGWMGYAPATEMAIIATERRLGRILPESLRSFYAVTNGWRQTGYFIFDVLPVEQLGWLSEREPYLYELALESEQMQGPWPDDPGNVRLQQYREEQGRREDVILTLGVLMAQAICFFSLILASQEPNECTKLKGQEGLVSSLVFSKTTLLSAGHDGTVWMWAVPSGRKIATFRAHRSPINALAVSRDGTRFATAAGDGRCKVWTFETQKLFQEIQGDVDYIDSVCFSYDSRFLAFGTGAGTVVVWDLQQSKQILAASQHSLSVTCLEFSADGKSLYSGSWDKTVCRTFLDKSRAKVVFKGHKKAIYSIAVSPDEKTVVTGSGGGAIGVWDGSTGRLRMLLPGHQDAVYSVALVPSKAVLVSGSWDATVRFWDLTCGKELLRYDGHEGAVYAVAVEPKLQLIASGGVEQVIHLVKVPPQILAR